MKKTDTKEPEVITAVVSLKPFESEKAALQEFVKDYDNIVVSEETYKECLKARAAVRDYRYSIDKTLDANNKTLNEMKKAQKAMAEELYAIILPVEERIDSGIKLIEKRKEDEKARKAKEEEERLAKIEEEKRLAMEAELQAEKDRLEAIRIEQEAKEKELKEKEAEITRKQEQARKDSEAKILEQQLAAQAEIDRKNKEAQDKIDKANDELKMKEKEAKKLQEEKEAELKKREEEHKKTILDDLAKKKREQEEAEEKIRIEQEGIYKQKEILREQKQSARTKELFALGLKFDGDGFVLKTEEFYVNVHHTDVMCYDDEKWAAMILKITPGLEEHKRKEAAREESERLQEEEESRLLQIEEDRKIAALRPDKEKLLAFAEMLGLLEYPELSGEIPSKQVLEQSQATILGLQVWIKNAVKNL